MGLGNWRQKVDTRGYDNPFFSSEEEIGQMDVPVEEEELLRESVRNLILEVTESGCNKHSLGWIDPHGKFHDITEHMEIHDEWMDRYQALEQGEYEWPMGKIPEGWIKVSNANELWLGGSSWDEITFQQFEGLCEMWKQCRSHSVWLSTDVENFYVTFGTVETKGMGFENMEQHTIPDFIGRYIGRRGEDLFYGMLLGEL